MGENDILRNRVTKLQALYQAALDEIERKNKIILDLAQELEN